jgi:hypothetical protein
MHCYNDVIIIVLEAFGVMRREEVMIPRDEFAILLREEGKGRGEEVDSLCLFFFLAVASFLGFRVAVRRFQLVGTFYRERCGSVGLYPGHCFMSFFL